MKLLDKKKSMFEKLGLFPRGEEVSNPVVKVLDIFAGAFGVQDLVNLMLHFAIHNYRQGVGVHLLGQRVLVCRFEQGDMKNRVYFYRMGEVKAESIGANLLENCEWSELFMVKLVGRLCGVEEAAEKPELIARFTVRG